MTTLDRVKALIADQVGIAASDINDDHDLKTIGMDSLDRVELAINIEEHFNIDVDDHDTDTDAMSTPAKIAVYVDARAKGENEAIADATDDATAQIRTDMLVHGIGIEKDGKRIVPEDFFITPITRDELLRRGVAHTDEDEAMVMSIIAKLGWPRHTEPFGTNPTHELVEIPQVSNIAGCTFRKKPVTIEAVQFSGIVDGVPTFALPGIPDWLAEACGGPEYQVGSVWAETKRNRLTACTTSGNVIVEPNDWIVSDENGEIDVFTPHTFARTYDAVEPAGEAHEPL